MTESTPEKPAVWEQTAGLLLTLRERHVFVGGTLLASVVSGLSLIPFPILVDDKNQTLAWVMFVRVTCLVLIAVFTAADKIADHKAKMDAGNELGAAAETAQKAYRQSISSLLTLAIKGANIAQESPGKRPAQLRELRTVLVTTTHGLSSAAQTRATFYTLDITEQGRILKDPVSWGRVEESTTIWVERDNPKHSVWAILDGQDVNAPIVRSTDEETAGWAEWEKKKYKSFISVPVKANGVQFGLLSLNAPNSDDLTQTDRMAVLVAARIMATTLSLAVDSNQLKDLENSLVKLKSVQAPVPKTGSTEENTSASAPVR